MWHVTHGGRWRFCQNFRSLAHATLLVVFNWPAQIIQSSAGAFPSIHVECLMSHHQLTKTFNQLCLSNPTEKYARQWSSSPPAQSITGSIFVSWICLEQLITPSFSAGDATFVPKGLGVKVEWRFGGKGRGNQWMTKVFVEQPWLHTPYMFLIFHHWTSVLPGASSAQPASNGRYIRLTKRWGCGEGCVEH